MYRPTTVKFFYNFHGTRHYYRRGTFKVCCIFNHSLSLDALNPRLIRVQPTTFVNVCRLQFAISRVTLKTCYDIICDIITVASRCVWVSERFDAFLVSSDPTRTFGAQNQSDCVVLLNYICAVTIYSPSSKLKTV